VALLLALRALEGFGFLLVVLPAPGLVRRLVAPERVNLMLGVWGAYMPLATASALLIGPLWMQAFGWRAWWWLMAAVSALTALWLARAVPDAAAAGTAPAHAPMRWFTRLRHTLSARGPWLIAASFAVYSSQWLAVIGFLPSIYTQAGIGGATTGVLTALAAAVNMVGNIGSGQLLHRGTKPTTLLVVGFVAMALSAALAFAGTDGGTHPVLRYAAVLAFSMIGGVIPGTLFALAVRVAPGEHTLSSTVGWVQQWSAAGQFVGPPLVAWVASQVGGWHLTWVATGACSLLGLVLTAMIARLPLR